MEYRNFEQHIANTLKSEELALDIQGLINDIHGKKKRRKGGFIWLWAVLGVLLLGSGAVLLNKGNKKDNTTESTPGNYIANKSTPISTDNNEEKTIERITSDNSIKLSRGQMEVKNSKKVPPIWQTDVSSNINTAKSVLATTILAENIIEEEKFETTDINENVDLKLGQRLGNNISALENKDGLSILAQQQKHPFISRDKIVCPTFSNNGKLYLEIIPEVGVFLPIKKLENKSTEVNNVFNQRNSGEKSLEGINAGLYLKLSKEKSPFYIKAGLSWSRLSEKMPLTYSYTRKDTTQGIISVTVSQTGDTITYIYGDIIQERKISGNKTKHYSISMVDLPMAIGAEKRFGSWFAGVEAGLSLNISMKSAGNILVSDTSFTAIDAPIEYFKQSVGLSYFGGVHIGKEFNNAGRLFLAARARFIPDSFSTDQNRIRQSYHFVGLNVGYVYTF